jgi:hypothetical protein
MEGPIGMPHAIRVLVGRKEHCYCYINLGEIHSWTQRKVCRVR